MDLESISNDSATATATTMGILQKLEAELHKDVLMGYCYVCRSQVKSPAATDLSNQMFTSIHRGFWRHSFPESRNRPNPPRLAWLRKVHCWEPWARGRSKFIGAIA